MARYRKIDVRTYGDEKFRELSAPPPNGQTLWLFLLTGRHTSAIPGLFASGEASLAESLRWPLKGFRKAFEEISSRQMATADWKAGLVWIPKAIKYNPPENPNVVVSWSLAIAEFPECALREEAIEGIKIALHDLGTAFEAAWANGAAGYHRSHKIDADTRDSVRARDGSTCRYCGCAVKWNDKRGAAGGTYDHIDPAGPGTAANVVVCCRSCNIKKGFRSPAQAGLIIHELSKSDLDSDSNTTDSDSNTTQVILGNHDQDQDQDQEQDDHAGGNENSGNRNPAIELFNKFPSYPAVWSPALGAKFEKLIISCGPLKAEEFIKTALSKKAATPVDYAIKCAANAAADADSKGTPPPRRHRVREDN